MRSADGPVDAAAADGAAEAAIEGAVDAAIEGAVDAAIEGAAVGAAVGAGVAALLQAAAKMLIVAPTASNLYVVPELCTDSSILRAVAIPLRGPTGTQREPRTPHRGRADCDAARPSAPVPFP